MRVTDIALEAVVPKRGELVRVGRALYGICDRCDSLVRVNKPILGGLHICDPTSDGLPR